MLIKKDIANLIMSSGVVKLFNYMLIQIVVVNGSESTKVQSKGMTEWRLSSPLRRGSKIRFLRNGREILAPHYVEKDNTGELHIGMISSRKRVDTLDSLPNIMDMSRVDVHNMTMTNLSFNRSILVPSLSRYKYLGDDMRGIARGFTFMNDDVMFEPFCIINPITDLYYGLVSEKLIPLFVGDVYTF